MKPAIIGEKDLDGEIESTEIPKPEEEPHWQQWIPAYGVGRAVWDVFHARPSITEGGFTGKYFPKAMAVHAVMPAAALITLYELLK